MTNPKTSCNCVTLNLNRETVFTKTSALKDCGQILIPS